MFSTFLKAGTYPHEIYAIVIVSGQDIIIHIGGEKEHLGAAALAVPRASLQDAAKISSTASVLCLTGHKEDEVAKAAALHLAAVFATNVLVSAGIHIDDAEAADLQILQENFVKLTETIEEWLNNSLKQ